jgi:hypothetical protein
MGFVVVFLSKGPATFHSFPFKILTTKMHLMHNFNNAKNSKIFYLNNIKINTNFCITCSIRIIISIERKSHSSIPNNPHQKPHPQYTPLSPIHQNPNPKNLPNRTVCDSPFPQTYLQVLILPANNAS